MVNGCVIIGCANGALKGKYSDKNVSMHAFPLDDQELCDQWVKAIKRHNFVPSKHSRLCSSHFQPSDLIEHSADTNVSRQRQHKDRKLTKRYLRKGAVPSIFPESLTSSNKPEVMCKVENVENLQPSVSHVVNTSSLTATSTVSVVNAVALTSTGSPSGSDTQSWYEAPKQETYQDEGPTDLSTKSRRSADSQDLSMRSIDHSGAQDPFSRSAYEYDGWVQTEPLDLSLSRSRVN